MMVLDDNKMLQTFPQVDSQIVRTVGDIEVGGRVAVVEPSDV